MNLYIWGIEMNKSLSLIKIQERYNKAKKYNCLGISLKDIHMTKEVKDFISQINIEKQDNKVIYLRRQ